MSAAAAALQAALDHMHPRAVVVEVCSALVGHGLVIDSTVDGPLEERSSSRFVTSCHFPSDTGLVLGGTTLHRDA